ncbi:SoxR reducing system RseC family protein [Desulfovibrio sp. JC022]|uniref:SoxR reducing system RseC family protein n=1 Tax=Desulfovibrio sp. JC022 TaxID=2593642 RepID=UPI0013D272A4|nr:SoxR reducing system RseC family protein [Desulfovibrio sp. JC022]NDV21900.1 SoxR reducing system RseC family protein [Desulfovibrio sp. JC022]
MLRTNKQKGIFIGLINAAFAVHYLLGSRTWIGVGLEFFFMIPGFWIAYWVYNRKEAKDDEKDS